MGTFRGGNASRVDDVCLENFRGASSAALHDVNGIYNWDLGEDRP